VEIIRYVTEGSFDVFSWQTVERKAAFIDQVTRGDVTERSVDDIGDQALGYAEVKALATGDPLIMERAGVASELTKLQRLQAAHGDEQARLARRAEAADRQAEERTSLAAAYRSAAVRAVDTGGERFNMALGQQLFTKRPEAAAARKALLLGEMQQLAPPHHPTFQLGELAGFLLMATVSRDAAETMTRLQLSGIPRSLTFSRDEICEAPALGLLARLENLSSDLSQRADLAERSAGESRQEAARVLARLGLPFEQTSRIESLRQRLAQIDALLAPSDGVGRAGAVGDTEPPSLAGVLDVSFPASASGVTPATPDERDKLARSFTADAVEAVVQAER
jgi:hypothetical protein